MITLSPKLSPPHPPPLFFSAAMNQNACTDCPVADAVAATLRMMEHRGTPWVPLETSVAGESRLAALTSAHARDAHQRCYFRVDGGTRLIVVTDLEKLPTSAIKQAVNPAFLASFGLTCLQLVSVSPPNAQTTRLLPSNVSVLPWSAILTYPLSCNPFPINFLPLLFPKKKRKKSMFSERVDEKEGVADYWITKLFRVHVELLMKICMLPV